MNLPNKLTLLRVALIPVFVAALFITAIPYRFLIAAAIYGVASVTDLLDGRIARKRNIVTDFGKLLDPLADKVFVSTALFCIICLTENPTWRMLLTIATIIIVAREFLVTSLRLLVASKGVVIPAAYIGKIKTTLQMIAIIFILIEMQFEGWLTETFAFAHWIGYILLAAAVVTTIISGVQYVVAYGSYLDPKQ